MYETYLSFGRIYYYGCGCISNDKNNYPQYCMFPGWVAGGRRSCMGFYKNFGKDFNVKRFVNACENGEIKKAYLYFHSYELLFGLIFLCFLTHFNYLLSFTTLGFAIHLFFDQIFNPVKPLTYFITYRILNSYNTDVVFRINPKS